MTMIETLQRQIAEANRAGNPIPELSMLAISDLAAWELAGELVQQQMIPVVTQLEVYDGMKLGGMKFMGWPVQVALEEAMK